MKINIVSHLKRSWKFYLAILLLAAICIWLAFKCVDTITENAALKNQKQQQVKAIQTEAREIARKVDEKGIEQVLFDVTQNVATKDQVKSNTKGIIDTTAMALDIRTKQLKEILVVNSSLQAENLKLKRMVGEDRRPYYTYQGNGLDLKFTPPVNDLDTADQGTADFKANLKIKATQYWKRNWFLGAKKSILAITSDNPYFKINGADYVEFEQEQPTFGLRIQANSSYNFDTGEIGFGPAARIDVGRFSFQGRYTKFPSTKGWTKSVNASFDLIRF